MTKTKHIKVFRSITTAGVDVSYSRLYRRNIASPSKANSMTIYAVSMLWAVNYQTLCNDFA